MYRLSPGNRQYLGVRLPCGTDQLEPYITTIAEALCPDLGYYQTVDVSEAEEALEDYARLEGHPRGMAVLAVEFVESCTYTVVQYTTVENDIEEALLRMYPEALERVTALPKGLQASLKKRLKNAKTDLENTGWKHAGQISEFYEKAFAGS